MTEEEYHNHPACSVSILKRILFEDEAYEVANNIKVEQTPFMIFGTLVHCLILEPHKFEKEYLIMPKVDGRTKEGKLLKAEYEEKAIGKQLISEEDYQRALNCVEALKESGAYKLFENGKSEKKYFTIFKDIPLYNEDGTEILEYRDVEVRGMIDKRTDNDMAIDLKLTQNFGQEFKKECGNRGHGMQLAFYNDLDGNINERLIVGIQAVPPHRVTIVRVSQQEIETGRDFYRTGLEIWLDIKTYPHKYSSKLYYDKGSESRFLEYETPFWQHLHVSKFKKG